MDYLIYFGAIIISVIIFLFYNIIKRKYIKIIYVITILFLISLISFILSLDGILYNMIIPIVLFIIGILLLIFSIIHIIKYKKINYFVFTPILIILFCIIGTYYGEIKYNKIEKVAEYIKINHNKEENNFDEILINIKIPKKMYILVIDNEYIIIYKDLIFFVNRGRYLGKNYININDF